jgi:hypothetical protein
MNKKIKNATKTSGFKSQMEKSVYNKLVEAGYNPKYEEMTFTLLEGFYPTIDYYTKGRKELTLSKTKVRSITYTPDFILEINDCLFIIEVKGFPNDVYPVKKKLFLNVLEKSNTKVIFVEIFKSKDINELLKIIKEYEENNSKTD